MIIVGNAVVLSKDNFWNSLLGHFKKHNCLFEGTTWKHLIQSSINFTSPEPHYGERTRFAQDVSESLLNPMNQIGSPYPAMSFGNPDLIGYFSQKFRRSQMGFEMLPEQRSSIYLSEDILYQTSFDEGNSVAKEFKFDTSSEVLEPFEKEVIIINKAENRSVASEPSFFANDDIMGDIHVDLEDLS